MERQWFSAKARLLCKVGGVANSIWNSVFVFRAEGWDPARERALQLGQEAEDKYINADGQEVVFTLLEIETLDKVGNKMEDGSEVFSQIDAVAYDGPSPAQIRRDAQRAA
jgi:hypothetical protein